MPSLSHFLWALFFFFRSLSIFSVMSMNSFSMIPYTIVFRFGDDHPSFAPSSVQLPAFVASKVFMFSISYQHWKDKRNKKRPPPALDSIPSNFQKQWIPRYDLFFFSSMPFSFLVWKASSCRHLSPETPWIFPVGVSEVMTVTIQQYNFPLVGGFSSISSVSFFHFILILL